MIKLIAFDLDDTLAPVGEAIPPGALGTLRLLEDEGVRLAVCSGKPVYYLCGFARQAGLRRAALVGENGAVIQLGTALPPARFDVLRPSPAARRGMDELRSAIEAALPDIWFQPNETCLTPFPVSPREHAVIGELLRKHPDALAALDVYHHLDSFDIVPKGVDKGVGLARLGAMLGVTAAETAAVGNGENDYPMFDYAALSVGVRVPDESRVDKNFDSLPAALSYLLPLVKGEGA